MGYCYEGRKLCCDACGHAGARKRPCPYGYCQAPAICEACWKGGKREECRQYHIDAHCKDKHEAYVAREAREAALVAAGGYLRVAAFGPVGPVTVWFAGLAGEYEVVVPRATYDAAADAETLARFREVAAGLGESLVETWKPGAGRYATGASVSAAAA